MNITLVSPSLLPGGAERAVVLLAEGFQSLGHTVSIITLASQDSDFYEAPKGVLRVGLNLISNSANLLEGVTKSAPRLKRIRSAVCEMSPAVVISHTTQTNILTALALSRTRCPVIAVEHSAPRSNYRRAGWRWLRRITYPSLAKVVSVSRGINDYFSWLTDSKKTVIPNPLRSSDFAGRHAEVPDAEKKQKIIVTMGRLIPIKGFDTLIVSFSSLAAKHPKWNLTIIGDGELRSKLEELSQKLGLANRITFTGMVKNPFTLLRSADLFVMPSRSEGLSYALLEAMASGLPGIAFAGSLGPEEIIRSGIDGLIVPHPDANTLASAMERLMNNDEERSRFGRRAVEVLERYEIKKVISQWENLFAELGIKRPGNT